MSAGKPILAMMNGEGPRIIAEAGCGLSVSAGDSEALAQAVLHMAAMPHDDLEQMGLRGRVYLEQHFNIEKCLSHLEQLLFSAN